MVEQETSVYLYYDSDDFLIYVGITGRAVSRNREHDKGARWWQYVARQEVEHFPSRTAAARREAELVGAFRPPFNVQHNPDAAEMRDAYLAWRQANVGSDEPLSIARQIGNRLPLVPFDAADRGTGTLVLRSRPEHRAVTSRLVMAGDRHVLVGNARARVRAVEVRGPFAVLVLRGRELPAATQVEGGFARFVCHSQKPVGFTIRSVRLEIAR